ncbi:MAG: hypothetical protein Q7V58_15785 [Actinomycetota bacterium]|nr:hypothetical protein [Actinomycetota bacterium]
MTLWKGIRQTADGQTCGELPDSDADQGSTPGVSVYDGLYHGQFAISGSTSPSMANAGPYTLTFTVSGGRISGDIDGTVSGNGLAAEIVSVEGLPCRAPNGLQFTQQGTVSGAVECSLGATTVWGNVTGNR